jgi:uncharacterized RDD family membrane protein YckC
LYYYPGQWAWARNDFSLDLITAGLGFVQVILVYRLEGSPGFSFVGLRVRNLEGGPIGLRKFLLRASPYLLALALSMIMPRSLENKELVELLSLGYFLIAGFILVSAFVLCINKSRSLLDMISATQVVYWNSYLEPNERHRNRNT